MNKKTISEVFGTGTIITNGYLRIPKVNWSNIVVAAINSPTQMMLAIIEKAVNSDSTVQCIYQETVITNEKINGDNIAGIYNKYLIKLTGINKAKPLDPDEV